ncbi:hypothetical protein H8S95_06960 [Pontibacter sp. KCTC 32443]|uniref:hypothetical protein n=1 Tax=Pontibacter TaxID=323449 RepID=UPI00164ED0D8|nr:MULTISPECIES: hypothetical protein [Pontibacter]MBC5773797.1 hypothetical protein [Pontibacter sp. KCTC 32443]
MNSWKSIKEKLYYEDGSLRDIYVFNTNEEDWKIWSKLVNEKYKVSFYNGRTHTTGERINVDDLIEYFVNPDSFEDVNRASIILGNVIINCCLYYKSEMESDIDPQQVKSENDHKAILEYMQDVALTLNKTVVLTTEMTKDDVLLEVEI